jgi:hypothetical protein
MDKKVYNSVGQLKPPGGPHNLYGNAERATHIYTCIEKGEMK